MTELYYFDGDLKLLLLEALELIEVDFKTKLINTLSLKYKNPHWFMDSQIFLSDSDFDLASEIIAKGIEKNRENIFIKHYEDKYNDPALPPSRMVFEILAFGETSRVFQALNSRDKKLIAKEYELFFPQLESWIACLAYLRNLSAHSDRVWNRRMTKIVKVK
ncbi:MAG: Abi family protein [Candidatus Peribacteria bacterium]|nr:Abi family protein [Candidatus Peribacteria bacterium]